LHIICRTVEKSETGRGQKVAYARRGKPVVLKGWRKRTKINHELSKGSALRGKKFSKKRKNLVALGRHFAEGVPDAKGALVLRPEKSRVSPLGTGKIYSDFTAERKKKGAQEGIAAGKRVGRFARSIRRRVS